MPDAQMIWEFSRDANKAIGFVVVLLLMLRLIPLLASMVLSETRSRDPRHWHRAAWFVYIGLSIANATAAAFNNDQPGGPPASWTSGTRLLLNVVAIGLCWWWPHPFRETEADDV